MPDITLIDIALVAVALLLGALVGWILRRDRCAKEKMAINAGWQQQMESQQYEHDRLADQNKSLMEQISQYQASHKDSVMRAKELSGSLKEAFARRDELQRQIKDIRGNLEVATAQRDRLTSNLRRKEDDAEAAASSLREKDDKIFRLSRELESWRERVPPLVDKFRERDDEARQLATELDVANSKIMALQTVVGSEHTRIEPVNADALPEGMDASNEPHSVTMAALQSEYEVDDNVTATASNGASLDGNSVDEIESDEAGWGDVRDDLKKIKGVGPAIEKTLNDLGIFRFHQIAEMSEFDIDRVAQQLKGFRSRIYREDWIGQARTLQDQRSSDLN